MEGRTTTRLSLPARGPARETGLESAARVTEEWLDELPVANLGETSRQVFDRLKAANRTDLPPAERFRLLGQLRGMVDYVADGMRKHYLGRELPLQVKPRRIASLATLLLQEMALGYETVIETMRSEGGARRRVLVQSLLGALNYRGRVLLENWLIYQDAPEGGWQRLHDLFTIAEHEGVAEETVRDEHVDGRPRRCPSDLYKLVVLASAAGPARMLSTEILDCWTLLEDCAGEARLLELADPSGREAVFRVPRGLDAPPHPSLTGLNTPDDRLLDTAPLIRLMDLELSRTGRSRPFWRRGSALRVHPEMIQRVLLALGAVAARQHRRLRAEAGIQVCVGMARIHRVLCAEDGLDPETANAEGPRFNRMPKNGATPGAGDVWDMIYPNHMIRALESEGADRQRQAQRAAQRADSLTELQDWHLVNISRGGYCLISDPSHAARVQVGELILLREVSDRALPWQLGAIRWMRDIEQRGLQMGVEMIAATPRPVLLENTERAGAPRERGLLIAADESLETPPTIITPGPHYRATQVINIVSGERSWPVSLQRERDMTQHYVQFEYASERKDSAEDEFTALFDRY